MNLSHKHVISQKKNTAAANWKWGFSTITNCSVCWNLCTHCICK